MSKKLKLTKHGGGFLLVPIHNNGKVDKDRSDIFVQSDWDFPPLAGNFGFNPCAECDLTDGTVDCEHKTASNMISEASDFLMSHLGQTFEDSGYYQ